MSLTIRGIDGIGGELEMPLRGVWTHEGDVDAVSFALGHADVSTTMIYFWLAGRYLPPLRVMDRMADALNDATLHNIVRDARTGRCPCGATFDRTQTRRQYCSEDCRRAPHGKGGRKADPRQDAIEAMCRACEPERICRDDSCALRPFSPFLFVALHRRTA